MTNKKGFTLIEIAIVLAIIGTLAATIYPIVTGKSPHNFNTEIGCAKNG